MNPDREATCAWDCQLPEGHTGECSRHVADPVPAERPHPPTECCCKHAWPALRCLECPTHGMEPPLSGQGENGKCLAHFHALPHAPDLMCARCGYTEARHWQGRCPSYASQLGIFESTGDVLADTAAAPVDCERLIKQAQDISVLLSDAGIGPGSITEGVRTLIDKAASAADRVSALTSALDEIANYILPSFTFNGEPYVKLDEAKYLRQVARNARLDPAERPAQ